MRSEIGKSYADIKVILERLIGRHVHGKGDKVGAIILAVFFTAAAAWMEIEQHGDLWVTLVVVMLLVFALAFVADAYAEFVISPEGVEKRLPLWGTVWRVQTTEIHGIDLWFMPIPMNDVGWAAQRFREVGSSTTAFGASSTRAARKR